MKLELSVRSKKQYKYPPMPSKISFQRLRIVT